MTTSTWVLEFSAPSIGTAQDLARQCTPAGQMVPVVNEQGRHGYEVRSDYGFIEKLNVLVTGDGGHAIMSRR